MAGRWSFLTSGSSAGAVGRNIYTWSIKWLGLLTVWQLGSEREYLKSKCSKRPSGSRKAYDPDMVITLSLSHHILLVKSTHKPSPVSRRGEIDATSQCRCCKSSVVMYNKPQSATIICIPWAWNRHLSPLTVPRSFIYNIETRLEDQQLIILHPDMDAMPRVLFFKCRFLSQITLPYESSFLFIRNGWLFPAVCWRFRSMFSFWIISDVFSVSADRQCFYL